MLRLLVWCLLVLAAVPVETAWAGQGGYAIVVSRATDADPDWHRVVEALKAKHDALMVSFDNNVDDALSELKEQFPRYVCFVAKPAEAGRKFVAQVHQLTRKLDDDIYTDAQWGILTGYDAAGALRIAQHKPPLTVAKVASGTEVDLTRCGEGFWYSELTQGQMARKERGAEAAEAKGPDDTTAALAESLNQYHADLFVTSGHATERDWQIGFRYRNGTFQSKAGKLFGVDTAGKKIPIESPNPKVYLPIGNCLMGHIDGPDAMALAWMNSAGVMQMIGYTVPTWYGYGGWGMLDYFVEQPGRYTFNEAFFANHQALLHRLEANFPAVAAAPQAIHGHIMVTQAARANGLTADDARGLHYDRDTVAFYGDPAWQARMETGKCAFDVKSGKTEEGYFLEIRPRDKHSFDPVNKNGSQRGDRPVVQLLPERIDVKSRKLIAGAELQPVITDNFMLVPLPIECDPARVYRIEFQATTLPR